MAHTGEHPQDQGRTTGPHTGLHRRAVNDIQPGGPGDEPGQAGTDRPAPAPGDNPSGPGHKEPPTGSNEGP